MFPSHIGSRSTYNKIFIKSSNNKFPSHIGSRSTNLLLKKHFLILSFHPTLVLAQLIKKLKEMNVPYTFPSHIGSRSTKPFSATVCNFQVSIPHWFSLNLYLAYAVVPCIVSIPHWFSLNETLKMVISMELRFHPTLVLAQPA